jgi:hypothetical protein
VNAFLAEAKADRVRTLDALNQRWQLWVEAYYHNKPHSGIQEYYESLGVSVPSSGITPLQEFNRDSRPLVFLDTSTVGEAFLHHENRRVDKGGCIRFRGRLYEVSTALIGANVEISYDPMKTETLTVRYKDVPAFEILPVEIKEFCAPKPFLLNYRFDSMSPMALILVGQTELWDEKLRLQRYAAIRQRIDMNCVLPHLDRAETEQYVLSHLIYAGGAQEIFTDKALDEVFRESSGIPRMINRICEKSLMYACQQRKKLVDDYMVRFVIEHELLS